MFRIIAAFLEKAWGVLNTCKHLGVVLPPAAALVAAMWHGADGVTYKLYRITLHQAHPPMSSKLWLDGWKDGDDLGSDWHSPAGIPTQSQTVTGSTGAAAAPYDAQCHVGG